MSTARTLDLQLQAYQSSWPDQHQRVISLLAEIMPTVRLESIGSTAVLGLCAKPVIDVMAGAVSLDEYGQAQTALAARGFAYRPEYEDQLPERRYFVRAAADGLPRVHLHGLIHGGVLWTRHLAFRDALRADDDLRHRYAELKQALALQHPHDKTAYTAGKAPFITAVLARLGL